MTRTHRFSQRRVKQDRRSGSMVKTWVAAFICIGLIGLVNSVHGQVVIDTDTVIDADNSFPNSSIELIDGDNPPTVVDIVEGGEVATIAHTRSAVRGSSILNVSGGQVYQVTTYDSSTLNFSGGEVFSRDRDSIGAWDNSTVNISGGSVGVDDAEDWHAVHANENSTVNITGGEIFGEEEGAIVSSDQAVLNISGGHIYDKDGALAIRASGSVNISGGTIDGISIGGGGSGNISGGTISSILASGNINIQLRETLVVLSGGTVESLRATDFSIIEVYGSNLILDEGRLTGVLTDGSMIDAAAQTMGSGQIVLVPEPSTLALLLAGLLVASFRRENTISSSSGNNIGGIR